MTVYSHLLIHTSFILTVLHYAWLSLIISAIILDWCHTSFWITGRPDGIAVNFTTKIIYQIGVAI